MRFIVFFATILLMTACNDGTDPTENNTENANESNNPSIVHDVPELDISYEEIETGINDLQEASENSLVQLVDIEVSNLSLEGADDHQDQLYFEFQIENIHEDELEIQFLFMAPEELEDYYLSSPSTEFTSRYTIDPGQYIQHTHSEFVKTEEMLSDEEAVFLNENGRKYYMYLEIDDAPYFYELHVDEEQTG